MKHYEQEIVSKFSGVRVVYVEFHKVDESFYKELKDKYGSKVVYIDPVDR
jgi:hypothetical protein